VRIATFLAVTLVFPLAHNANEKDYSPEELDRRTVERLDVVAVIRLAARE
jgi:hypothetical protein